MAWLCAPSGDGGWAQKVYRKQMPNLFALSTKGRSSPDVLVGCRPALPGCWRLAKGGQQRFRHPVRCGGNPSLIDVRQRAAQRRDAGLGVQEEGLRTPRSPTSTLQLPAVACRITRGSEAAPIGTVLRTRRRPLEAPSPGGAHIQPTRRPYGRRSTTPSPLLAKYRGLH